MRFVFVSEEAVIGFPQYEQTTFLRQAVAPMSPDRYADFSLRNPAAATQFKKGCLLLHSVAH